MVGQPWQLSWHFAGSVLQELSSLRQTAIPGIDGIVKRVGDGGGLEVNGGDLEVTARSPPIIHHNRY